MDGLYFSSLSDRLRNCRGAAVTPSQSVTATAFPAITQQEGSTAVFLPNPLPTQLLHSSPFSSVCSGLQVIASYLEFSICMCLCRGVLQGDKSEQLPCGCRRRTWYWWSPKRHKDKMYVGRVCMKTHQQAKVFWTSISNFPMRVRSRRDEEGNSLHPTDRHKHTAPITFGDITWTYIH